MPKFEIDLNDNETDLLFTALEDKVNDYWTTQEEDEYKELIKKLKEALKL